MGELFKRGDIKTFNEPLVKCNNCSSDKLHWFATCEDCETVHHCDVKDAIRAENARLKKEVEGLQCCGVCVNWNYFGHGIFYCHLTGTGEEYNRFDTCPHWQKKGE